MVQPVHWHGTIMPVQPVRVNLPTLCVLPVHAVFLLTECCVAAHVFVGAASVSLVEVRVTNNSNKYH